MRQWSFGAARWALVLASPLAGSTSVVADSPIAAPLSFRDLAPASPTQRFSARVLSLHGQAVRIVGYMAHSEDPPVGMFHLCALPVFLDESGGGTADLPPDTIRVSLPALAGRPVPYLPKVLEVVGTLDLGRREEADGQVSWVRLTVQVPPPGLDDPTDIPGAH